jgi:hypothetical protein
MVQRQVVLGDADGMMLLLWRMVLGSMVSLPSQSQSSMSSTILTN